MNDDGKLTFIKSIHTLIWIFFNVVIFYMLFAAITNRLDILLWAGYGLILLEAIVLVLFKMSCPLTLIARNYSDSSKENFDIYLPNWLARNNKSIYSTILLVVILITLYQLFR